jgi:hypothetical protein
MTIWPPLPSTVFACLPALRTAYNYSYERVFGELNRKWIREVQPRQSEPAEGQENNMVDLAHAEEEMMDEAGNGGLVVQLDINLGDRGEEEPPPAGEEPQNNDQGPAGEDGNAPAEAAPAGEGAGGNANQGAVHQMLGQQQNEIVTSGIGETVLGALAFPVVAAGMGGLLSYALPESWMSSANWMNGRPGLLRHRWGRSVVGGCLFIALKDALVLYCRWKLAQTHRQRRVMDYDKKTKEYRLAIS